MVNPIHGLTELRDAIDRFLAATAVTDYNKTLINIGERAIAVDDLRLRKSEAKYILDMAYAKWREENGMLDTNIERETDQWRAMLKATEVEYQSLQRVSKDESNATRRMRSAISRFRRDFRT